MPTLLNGFPDGAVVKNPPASAEDTSLVPGSGRSPREGNGSLENSMDRGAWQAIVHGVERLGHD